MDFFNTVFDNSTPYIWEEVLGDYFFVFAIGFLIVELIRYAAKKKLNWDLMADTTTNFITLAFYITVSAVLFGGLYMGGLYTLYENYSLTQIAVTPLSVVVCIILADIAYYWEHRFAHRAGFAWLTHTVHHSSPHFNISVAYRFGPLDGFYSIFFYLPLAALGFHPLLILFAEMFVQIFQTILHTEMIKKLPRPIEAIFNTPSHHRVHHGSNPEYLDTNYAGIFIIWDKMFGTYAEEKATVKYGLVTPIESNNPFIVFFHGFSRLFAKMRQANSVKSAIGYFFMPPDWVPADANLDEEQPAG